MQGHPLSWRRCPTILSSGFSKVVDWDKKWYKIKSGNLLSTQKVYEGRLKKLAEPIPLQEARAQNLEIVYGKWLDDVARSCKKFISHVKYIPFHQKYGLFAFN